MICPNCGIDNVDIRNQEIRNQEFCFNCGVELIHPSVCPECKEELPTTQISKRYCPFCKANLIIIDHNVDPKLVELADSTRGEHIFDFCCIHLKLDRGIGNALARQGVTPMHIVQESKEFFKSLRGIDEKRANKIIQARTSWRPK